MLLTKFSETQEGFSTLSMGTFYLGSFSYVQDKITDSSGMHPLLEIRPECVVFH